MTRFFRYLLLTFIFFFTFVPLRSVLFSEEETEDRGEFRAILIGIDDYKSWPGDKEYRNLTYCVNDIEAIHDILKKNGYKDENITVIKEETVGHNSIPATKNRIVDTIKEEIARCEKNDVLLIYFSGHGIHLDGQNYLVPYDGKFISKDQTSEERSKRKESLINVYSIYTLLANANDCKAKTKYLITDACQENIENILASGRGSAHQEKSEFQINAKDIPAGLIQISSCSAGEISYERNGHGLFSAALINGIQDKADENEDGQITITELFHYVSKEVPKAAKSQFGKSQNPSMESRLSREIVFAYNPKKMKANALKQESQKFLADSRKAESETEKKSQLETAMEKLTEAQEIWPGGEYNYLEKEIKDEIAGLTVVKVKKLNEEALTLLKSEEYEKALAKINEALEYDSENQSNKSIKELIVKALEEQKPDPQKAAQKVAGEAWQHYQSKDYEEALEKIEEAIKLDESNWQYSLLKEKIETAMKPSPAPSKPEESSPVIPSEDDSTLEAGAKKTIRIKGIEYTFRWCPAGTFEMGSPESEEDRYYDETQHRVTLSEGFWLLEHEVTQEMWESVMGENPSDFSSTGEYKDRISGSTGQYPVEEVSWTECQTFIQKIQETAPAGQKFALPRESQWEYACRAGTKGEYGGSGDLDEMGWYGHKEKWGDNLGNSNGRTHEVKTKKANAWGLYDMHGNVWEWCEDWKDDYPSGSVTDPQGPNSGSLRVDRGGGWSGDAQFCRSANRSGDDPEARSGSLGFRLALSSTR